jgi:hypothetical protein
MGVVATKDHESTLIEYSLVTSPGLSDVPSDLHLKPRSGFRLEDVDIVQEYIVLIDPSMHHEECLLVTEDSTMPYPGARLFAFVFWPDPLHGFMLCF